MKILLVSSFLPHPLFTGGYVRLYNILLLLSKKHEITLVCEKRPYQTQDDIRAMEKICKRVIVFERKNQWSLRNILKTGFSKDSFLIVGHTNLAMRKKVEMLVESQEFDLIHVETSYVFQNIPQTSVPTVLVEHNIEYLVYKRYADTAPFFLRPFMYADVMKLRRMEEAFWRKATKVVVVSEKEKRLIPRDDVEVVPNGVNIQKFKIQNSKFKIDGKERKVLFIGDFRWIQNRDSITWILKEIWPEINSKLDVKLWIVGRNIPSSIKKLGDGSVIFDDIAPKETEKIFQLSDVLLAPVRVGGGTSFKILEAMASGVAIVTTLLGAEGMDARNGKEVLLANSPVDLADSVARLLTDQKLFENITKNARKLIEEKYDWNIIVKKLEGVYNSAVSHS